MAKSTILKQLANNEISLEIALSRLLIIASDIENKQLSESAEKELNGYEGSDSLPSYRFIGAGRITYSGINGRYQMTNCPIPITTFPPEIRESLERNGVYQSVGALKGFAEQNTESNISVDLTMLAQYVFEKQHIRCTSISMELSYADFMDVLNKIRTNLLNIYIRLDKELGNLDKLDIDSNTISKKEMAKLQKDINAMIYSDNHGEVL